MTYESDPPPLLSVVIPTYKKPDLLRLSLESLAAQRFPAGQFEVVVAEDARDDTSQIVGSFASRLRVRYHRQQERGFRAATRNAGARLASAPVLVFIDQGVIVGPDFVRAYLDGHRAPGRRAFIGYTHGYSLTGHRPGLAGLIAALPPEQVIQHYARTDPLTDMRHDQFARADFDLRRLNMPWALFWTVNVSVRSDDLWAVGGFDQDIQAWGVEDVEFAYRLVRSGVRLEVSRQAWAIDSPHDRDMPRNRRGSFQNATLFWDKHRSLEAEMYWAVYGRWHGVELSLEQEYGALLEWGRAAEPDVCAELDRASAGLPPEHRLAVIGCGGTVPARWRSCALADFDAALLERAAGRGGHITRHAVGVRTGLPEACFDAVLITSRMAGLWPRWGEMILDEARRIGGQVRVLF